MFGAKKSLGQHWLNDAEALQAIVDEAKLETGETVLEIGPGLGSLTARLLKTGAQVWAVELDQSLIQNLNNQFGKSPNFKVDQSDILKFNFTQLPENYKIVANIPYYVTAQLLRILTDPPTPKPQTAVLLVQKEVAERVCAKPGAMSILAVAAQLNYKTSLGALVPAELFDPAPKVDSQVLILQLHDQPPFADLDHKRFMQIVKAGFGAKRKTLLNSLSGGLQLSKPETEQILHQAKIDPQVRAQNLSLQQWHQIYQAITVLK